jgi:outer membrane lipoprotein-sorting protein
MSNYLKFLLLFLFSSTILANSEKLLLEAVDKYRSPYLSTKMDISITAYKDNSATGNDKYEVYHHNGESLVLIISGASKGNRVLLSNKGMYVAVKKSSRAIRITPIQRLLGQASYGDLASLKFSDDYNAKILREEQDTIVLELNSKSKKSTYTKIHLWIDKDKHYPIKADAYLASGKIYKIIHYSLKDNLINNITYTDPKINNKKTVMSILKIEKKKLSKRFFTSSGMKGKI